MLKNNFVLKLSMIVMVTVLAAASLAMADSEVTIDDLQWSRTYMQDQRYSYGTNWMDVIGDSTFETSKIVLNFSNPGTTYYKDLKMNIYTNFPSTGGEYGSVAADLFLSLGGTNNYAIAMTDHGGTLIQGALYQVTSYQTSIDIYKTKSGLIYGGEWAPKGTSDPTVGSPCPVYITGTTGIPLTPTSFNWDNNNHLVTIGLNGYNNAQNAAFNNINLFWGTGNCANDAIQGSTLGPVVPFTLALQPDNKHSTLIEKGGNAMRDYDFAKIIQNTLIKGGTSNVKNATFLFQECFGGGMLDDLKTALGTQVTWVGGSASTYDQVSYGEITALENSKLPKEKQGDPRLAVNSPQDWWTKALTPELGANQTVYQSINVAAFKDGAGINGTVGKLEIGQSISMNGGDTITLKDSMAKSYYAVLWGGNANGLRFFGDIDNMLKTLKTLWDATSYTIDILYGDGVHETTGSGLYNSEPLPDSWNQGNVKTQAATFSNLRATMEKVAMNLGPDSDFFFFASNHGGLHTIISTITVNLGPSLHFTTDIFLSEEELFGMRRSILQPPHVEVNGNDPSTPTLTINYENPISGQIKAQVSLNGHLLGWLDPDNTESQFTILLDWLDQNNEIDILNMGISSLTLGEIFFDTGAIETFTPTVPLPASVWLFLSGLAGLGIVGRGRIKFSKS